VTDTERIVFKPQPGLQERAASCTADIAILGGAAGCGKSWISVFEAARNHNVPGYGAIIFRRLSPELMGSGSVWEEAQGMYPYLGAHMREDKLDCQFPSGASIRFSHMQREKDKFSHKSKSYALIIFEEVTDFTEGQFWYLYSRNRSTCGVRPYMRATCNPDPDSFVRKLIDWWIGEDGLPIPERSGVLRWFTRVGDEIEWADTREELLEKFDHLDPEDVDPSSFTFIGGTLDDNPALTSKDRSYRGKLAKLPRVERERLLGGNWNVRVSAGDYFKRSEFRSVRTVPGTIVKTIRGWDRAASEPTEENPEPNATAGVKMAKLDNDKYIVLHVEWMQKRGGAVDTAIVNTAALDGRETTVGLYQDPAAAGKREADQMALKLAGFDFEILPTTQSKEVNAAPYSSQVQHDNVYILEGDWNERFLTEHESFPKGKLKDQVDAASLAFNLLQEDEWELV
jgi:predicted phage terminase large subunit-like protein